MKHLLLCLSALLVCAVVVLLPRIPQDPAYHVMADQRTLGGLPNAFDVVSNLPFAVIGLAGLMIVMKRRPAGHSLTDADHQARWAWIAFFAATAATALGSVYYHLSPDNHRVVWDRLPIAIACVSLLTAVISERVSPRAGRLLSGAARVRCCRQRLLLVLVGTLRPRRPAAVHRRSVRVSVAARGDPGPVSRAPSRHAVPRGRPRGVRHRQAVRGGRPANLRNRSPGKRPYVETCHGGGRNCLRSCDASCACSPSPPNVGTA